ncbi:hypothetical protein [Natrinema amylolyticum]|uniref:hypothetical protein n=1 Tax=Natrinema amylolyticum TaxID=2878679 RepID=UPI001CFB4568|nr:hypothetical protein [Natrinema amylolyticum]
MSTDPTATEVFEEVEADPDAILAAFDADSPADLVDAGGDHDPSGDHDPRPDDVVDTTATELFADLADVETPESNATDSEMADADSRIVDSNRTDTTAADSDGTSRFDEADDGAPTRADLAFEFIGDSDVTVRDDGDVIDDTAAELGALTASDPAEPVSAESPGSDDPTDPVSAESTDLTDSDDRVETAASLDAGSIDAIGSTDATASSGRLTIRGSDTDDLELVGPEPTPTRISDDTFDSAGVDAR